MMKQDLHFGLFHTGLEKGCNGFNLALNTAALDLFICECGYRSETFDTQLRKIGAAGKQAFITFSYLLFYRMSKEEQIKKEQYALEHLYNFARCLEKEKNPGDLLFYTWITFGNDSIGTMGLDRMTTEYGWKQIIPAIESMCKKLRQGQPVGNDYLA